MTERQRRRLVSKHFAKLGDLLAGFYKFLGSKPQPSEEEVRSKFIEYRTAWKTYAIKNDLDKKTQEEFTRQVSIVWHQNQNTTENATQQ